MQAIELPNYGDPVQRPNTIQLILFQQRRKRELFILVGESIATWIFLGLAGFVSLATFNYYNTTITIDDITVFAISGVFGIALNIVGTVFAIFVKFYKFSTSAYSYPWTTKKIWIHIVVIFVGGFIFILALMQSVICVIVIILGTKSKCTIKGGVEFVFSGLCGFISGFSPSFYNNDREVFQHLRKLLEQTAAPIIMQGLTIGHESIPSPIQIYIGVGFLGVAFVSSFLYYCFYPKVAERWCGQSGSYTLRQ